MPSIVLNPTKDTTLYEAGAVPAGADAVVAVGRDSGTNGIYNGIFHFDLSSITPGSTISSAVLTLRCTLATASGAVFDMLVVDPAKSSWVEAEADWDEYSTGNFWDTVGGDFDPDNGDIVFNLPTTTGDKTYTVTSLVQTAFTTQGLSFVGLFPYYTVATAEFATFTSKEGAVSARWPRLAITYTEPSPRGDLHYAGRVSQEFTGRLLG